MLKHMSPGHLAVHAFARRHAVLPTGCHGIPGWWVLTDASKEHHARRALLCRPLTGDLSRVRSKMKNTLHTTSPLASVFCLFGCA